MTPQGVILQHLTNENIWIWSSSCKLKTKVHQFENFVVMGGTVICHYDNLWCHDELKTKGRQFENFAATGGTVSCRYENWTWYNNLSIFKLRHQNSYGRLYIYCYQTTKNVTINGLASKINTPSWLLTGCILAWLSLVDFNFLKLLLLFLCNGFINLFRGCCYDLKCLILQSTSVFYTK